jgi:hypothetical protein
MSAWVGRRGPPTPFPAFLQKSAELIERKGLSFLTSAKKSKRVQKSAQEFEKAEVKYWEQELKGEMEPLHPHCPGICKSIKGKELLDGQFVSA